MSDKVRVLIVEDEAIVALDIKSALKKLGHDVVKNVSNYDDALTAVNEHDIDIILMDVDLKNSKDGIETAKAIKTIKDIPLIYLTAFSDEETISRAVETNPVGYLNKPFRREELKSNILLAFYKINRSEEKKENPFVSLGSGYFFDSLKSELYYDEIPIKLGTKEKQLLKVLVDAKGQIVSFEDIEYLLWPDGNVSESSLRTLIYRIRTKLDYKLIKTVPTFGCKIES